MREWVAVAAIAAGFGILASFASKEPTWFSLANFGVAAAAVVGYGALGFAEGMIAIMAVYAFASAAYTPVFLLTDAYALRGLAERGRAYGPVRLWGSAAFIAASLGAGSLLDLIPARDLIWLIVAAMGLAAATACALAPLSGRGARLPATHPSAKTLLRNPAFLAVAAAASLVQASHALYYGFSTIDWQSEGFDGTTIGALWALGVLAEIVLFAVSARLPIAPTALILIGAANAVIRWGAMALAPPAAALPALQCLHALSFGATHLGALGLKEKEIPPLHIGEFGVGRGGLRHPNLWAGAATAEQEKQLAREIARGHEGLMRYLALPEGRTVKSAVLWVLGQHYDVFGWENPKYANPEAAAAIKGALHAAAPPPK
jgi:hypothetical protein